MWYIDMIGLCTDVKSNELDLYELIWIDLKKTY